MVKARQLMRMAYIEISKQFVSHNLGRSYENLVTLPSSEQGGLRQS